MNDAPFLPTGNTVAIAVTSTSSNAQITATPGVNNYRICNTGTAAAFIAIGNASTTAAVIPTVGSPAAGIPIPAGAATVLSGGPNIYVAAISAPTTSTTLYVTPGDGI